MTYDLEIEIEECPFLDDGAKANADDDMTEGGDGQQDDIMYHDKHGDVPKSTGQTSQTSDAPMEKGTAPTSTPMVGFLFGSFGEASAPGRLWGGRVEAGDPAEQEPPPLSPAMLPACLFAITEETTPIVPSTVVLGGSPRQVASSPTPTSPPMVPVSSPPTVLGGSPRQAASTPSPASPPVVRTSVRTVVSDQGGLPTGRGSPVVPLRNPTEDRSSAGHSVEDVVVFGGIPDTMAGDRRVSQRIQD